ncbi:MAG: hypothetical protein QOF09_4672 [Alphaproteobacteria bacterium]|nr:hypothetical protein [Alphaproteobacteria bacterium]
MTYPGRLSILSAGGGRSARDEQSAIRYLKATNVRPGGERKVNFLVQIGLKRAQTSRMCTGAHLAKPPQHREMIEFVSSPGVIVRPFGPPHGVSEDRVRALRAAFNSAVADPECLADAARRNMHVELVRFEKGEAIVQNVSTACPKRQLRRHRVPAARCRSRPRQRPRRSSRRACMSGPMD